MKANNFIKLIFYSFLIFGFASLFSGDFVITTSGYYTIGSPLLSVQGAGQTSIVITVSNVTLDLGGTMIQGNNSANLTGITVNAGLHNVVIRNGIVAGFNGNGISIGAGCQVVILQDLIIDSCTLRAIDAVGTGASLLQDLTIKNCVVSNCSTGAAADFIVNLDNCTNANIDGLNINLTTNAALPISALRFNSCSASIAKNVVIASNSASVFRGVFITGASQRLFFKDVVIQNNTATGAADGNGVSFYGFALDGTASANGNIFQDCIVRLNTGTAAAGGQVTPFDLRTNVSANIFQRCIVEGNIAASTALPTISINTSAGCVRNVFQDCVVNANSQIGGQAYTGIVLNGANFQILDRCIVSNNTSTASLGTGILFTGAANDNQIRNCQVYKNQGSTNANSFGIRVIVGSVRNLFTSNISYDNAITAPGTIGNQLNGGVFVAGNSITPATLTTGLSVASATAWINLGGIQ